MANHRNYSENRVCSSEGIEFPSRANELLKYLRTVSKARHISTGTSNAIPSYVAYKQRILIVEDNADCRELLALVLRRSGYEVAEAATGLAAVEQAFATHPDLILMDLGLPGISGDEATARLKADPSTRDIPVIVNTAFNKGALVDRALAVGAAEIMHKPISFEALREVVARYLSPNYPLNPSPSRANAQLF